MTTMNVVEDFVEKHLKLLKIEHEEEVKEKQNYRERFSLSDLQQRGVCLAKLKITGQKTGLFGRFIVIFSTALDGKPLPSHSFGSGDIVGIHLKSDRTLIASGVIVSLTTTAVSVAFDSDVAQLNGEENGNYCLVKLANEVTYKRIKNALNDLRRGCANGTSRRLIDVLFGEGISDPLDDDLQSLQFINENLNCSQRDAVRFALQQKEVAIIHGPPGTGKTTTLVEVILQCVEQGNRVLVCAPSNVAVDTLIEKLAQHKPSGLLRLGHPARALPSTQSFSLDAMLSRSDQHQLIDDIRKEIDTLRKSGSNRGHVRSEIGLLRKELKAREKKALTESLKSAKIILSTLTSAASDSVLKHLVKSDDPSDHFDVVFVDECSQAIEAACWIVLGYAPKCILAGDHKQLPPTIVSEVAAKGGLEETLIERLLKLYQKDEIMRMLSIQYRMNAKIMQWSSKQFYDCKLHADDSVANHTVKDLVSSLDLPPLLLIDTAGCSMNELDVEDEMSRGNESEANLVSVYVDKLVKDGLNPICIGVITPYNLQVELIRNRIGTKYPSLEVNSVDGFQGREKEVIVLSLVRSNARKEVGFLSEFRRINVAVTRAKRHLAIICDSETVSNDEILSSLIEYMTENGEMQCAQEYEKCMSKYDSVERPKNLKLKSTTTTSYCEKTNKKIDRGRNNQEHFSSQENRKEQEACNEKIKTKFQTVLNDFMNSTQKFIVFSKNLTSYERMLVHELAEGLKLQHKSTGEGSDRVLEVRKPEESCKQTESSDKNKLPKIKDSQDSYRLLEEDTIDVKCLNDENEKETIAAENLNAVKPKAKDSKNDLTKKSTQNKPSVPTEDKLLNHGNFKKKLQDLKNVDEDDFDKMIEAVKKIDSICSLTGCKTKVGVLGQNCQFCHCRFCYSHAMPEIHGCGNAIKAYCRSVVRKDGKLYHGSGVPDKKPDSTTRSQLEKKLNKKVTALSEKRKAKRK